MLGIENMNTLILPIIQFHFEGLLSPKQLSYQLQRVSEYIMRPWDKQGMLSELFKRYTENVISSSRFSKFNYKLISSHCKAL
jgi:hypothetical protein